MLTYVEQNIISGGSTGIIELLPCGKVCKKAYPNKEGRKQSLRDIELEHRIYQRIGSHDRFLRMEAYSPEDGLILEYMSNGNLRQRLREASLGATVHQRLQWAHDAAEAVDVLHGHGIIHCDLKPENFLLDSALRLRVIDFSGSSIDGGWASAFESVRFCLPRPWDEKSTIVTDIFALGSTIFEIMTGKEPYEDLLDDEVEERFRQGIFPSVNTICCGEIIIACWHAEVKSAAEVMKYIKTAMTVLPKPAARKDCLPG
jgi:serine/threonine protein kinase